MKLGMTFPLGLARDSAANSMAIAERGGISSIWVYENLYGPGVFASAGFTALATETAEICIGGTSPFARAPVALAMEAAQLQDLSEGRFTLGLVASNPKLIEGMGSVAGSPLAGVEDTLRIVRKVTSGGLARYEGARFSVSDANLMWEPSFPSPGLIVGTMKPKMMAVAANYADGILISAFAPIPMIKRVSQAFKEIWHSAKREGEPRIVAYTTIALRNSIAETIDDLRPIFAPALARLPVDPTMGEMLEEGGSIDLQEARILADKIIEDPANSELIPDNVVTTHTIAATPENYLQQLMDFKEAGVTDLVFFELTQDPAFEETIKFISENNIIELLRKEQ